MPTLAEILATRTPPPPMPQPLPPARTPALAPALKALPSVHARTPATPRPVARYRTETAIWRTGRVERIRVFEGGAGEETSEVVSLFHAGGPDSPCYIDPDDPPPVAAA